MGLPMIVVEPGGDVNWQDCQPLSDSLRRFLHNLRSLSTMPYVRAILSC